jgi:glutamate synthase (NADPH/NADH) small chain
MQEEGIEFRTGVHVGVNHPAERLLQEYDAICLTGGSTQARDLNVPGRELDGVHLAMEYLPQQNRQLTGETVSDQISADGKRVVILGGGDTGADCLGTAHRQGAEIVRQFELLPEPPTERNDDNPWPLWPMVLRTSGAHEEGGIRDYNILTKSFGGDGGQVKTLNAVRVDWSKGEDGRFQMSEVPNSEFSVDADLVLLAMGFLHPEHDGMLEQLGVKLDGRGNVQVDANKMTSVPGVFAGGDMVRGQSLVVWAIAEGRDVARGVDAYLTGATHLPRTAPAI